MSREDDLRKLDLLLFAMEIAPAIIDGIKRLVTQIQDGDNITAADLDTLLSSVQERSDRIQGA